MICLLTAGLSLSCTALAGQSLTNGLVAHWPLDVIEGDKTPDVVSGYDMQLMNLTPADLVPGYWGNCFSFDNSRQTMLFRIHDPDDDLPINKHPAWTISIWVNVVGTGQADLRIFSEANTTTSNPLFNIGTDSTAGSGVVDFYFRQAGWPTLNHVKSVGQPLDGTWHHIVLVQQDDGSRFFYIDGVQDPVFLDPKPAGAWNLNNTTIGGILRASPSHWVTGLIDDVALWKRALTVDEINEIRTNGVPSVTSGPGPLEIRVFESEYETVAGGDTVWLHWEASKDATLTLSGVGDVTATSEFGVGSLEVIINSETNFTLTATRDAESVSSNIVVHVLSGVAAGWHLIENFDRLDLGPLAGKDGWLNPEGVFSVEERFPNHLMGYDGGDDLAARPLRSLTVLEGQDATLFFRLFVADTTTDIGINLGLTEKPIRFNGDFGGNVGPYIRLERTAGQQNVTIAARNGVGAGYTTFPDIIEPGVVYDVWLDVQNRPFIFGDLYSLYIRKAGDPDRTPVFENYIADRDAVNIDPALGAPKPDLIYVFFSALDPNLGVNNLLFDDIYLSADGINAGTPVPPPVFIEPLRIRSITFDPFVGTTITWRATPGKTYTVWKVIMLGDPWFDIAPNVPASGTPDGITSYTDLDAIFDPQGFYIISENP